MSDASDTARAALLYSEKLFELGLAALVHARVARLEGVSAESLIAFEEITARLGDAKNAWFQASLANLPLPDDDRLELAKVRFG